MKITRETTLSDRVLHQTRWTVTIDDFDLHDLDPLPDMRQANPDVVTEVEDILYFLGDLARAIREARKEREDTCPDCGNSWYDTACGPKHELVYAYKTTPPAKYNVDPATVPIIDPDSPANVLAQALPKALMYVQRATLEVIARGGSQDEAVAAGTKAASQAFEFWIINGIWPDEAEELT